MKQKNRFKLVLYIGLLISPSSAVIADVSVDKSNGILTIASDIDGTIHAKIIGPDDSIVVNDRFIGNSFSWAPSSGPDGAYRYDVRFFPNSTNTNSTARLSLFNTNNTSSEQEASEPTIKSEYAGGSVEVVNGQIDDPEEAMQ